MANFFGGMTMDDSPYLGPEDGPEVQREFRRADDPHDTDDTDPEESDEQLSE
jgi:hypothetical protein